MGPFFAILPVLATAGILDDLFCLVTGCYSGACASLCDRCSGPLALECQSCTLNSLMTSEGCACLAGFFPSGNVCADCHSSCGSCFGDQADQCETCKAGLTLVGNSCECPVGQYWGPAGGCVPCHETCRECYGPSKYQCVSCQARASLHLSRCNCISGYYPNPHSGNCSECHPSCYSCFGPGIDQCKECHSHALLSLGMCMCKEGYYHRNETACLSCDNTCRSCSGPTPTQCLTCRTGAVNWAGKCSCAQGYLPSPDSSACKPCLSTCRASNSQLQCFHPSQKLTKRMESPTVTQMKVAEVLCSLENAHAGQVPSLADAFIIDVFEFTQEVDTAVVTLLHLRSKTVRSKGLELIHAALDAGFNRTVVVFTQPKKHEARPTVDDYSPGKPSILSVDNWDMVEDLVYPFAILRRLVTTQEDGTNVQVVELCAEAKPVIEPKRRLLEALYASLSGKNISIQFS